VPFGICQRLLVGAWLVVSDQVEIGAAAAEILETLLGYLGFVVKIERETQEELIHLQIFSGENQLLIGKRGERLDDIQYLVNRLLHARFGDVGRVRVDAGHYRLMQEERFLGQIGELAEKVRYSGKAQATRPLNAYFRRLVHEALREDPGVTTESENSRKPLKRVTLRRR
jgi:spoIIIJ-associated protein